MDIVLYGAGKVGAAALASLGASVAHIVDSTRTGEILGRPIERLEDLPYNTRDEVLFLITPRRYRREIASTLLAAGYSRFLLYEPVHAGGAAIPLTSTEWGELYNERLVNDVVAAVTNAEYKSWTRELLAITEVGSHVLEIGCGSGVTTLALAQNGRECTALDYSEASIRLLDMAAERLGISVRSQVADAREPLPFATGEFDVAFQAGLLEHFTREERIALLRIWRPVARQMVSLIPNAASVPYRAGKKLAEAKGDWEYGLELPQYSLIEEFSAAGYSNLREYTIGLEDALVFLPEDHYLRIAFERYFAGHDDDIFGQGYLLCTIGEA